MTSLREQHLNAIATKLKADAETAVEKFFNGLLEEVKKSDTKASTRDSDNRAVIGLPRGLTVQELIALPAYRKLHTHCAGAEVDMRIKFECGYILSVEFNDAFNLTANELRLDLPPPVKQLPIDPPKQKSLVRRVFSWRP